MPDWKKEVLPQDGFASPFRFGPPKQLKSVPQVEVTATYEPNVEQLLTDALRDQVVTVPPLFKMSRGYSPYRAKDIFSFRGYLSKVEFDGMAESGEPFVTVTLQLAEDKDGN